MARATNGERGSRSHAPIARSLRPPPYDDAVSNRLMPRSHAASITAKACSSDSPLPTSDRSDPMPPKFPQPRMIRSGAIRRSATGTS